MLSQSLRSMIPVLKEKYGNIYLLDVSSFAVSKGLGSDILLRAMSRAGFNAFTDSFLVDPIEAVRTLISTHSFGYESLDKYKAGIDEYICSAISKVSGFGSEESLAEGVQYGRNYAQSLEAAITMYICKAFPTFTPKDIDNLTLDEQMKYVALAEQMIGKELPYIDYLSPKKIRKKSNVPRAPMVDLPTQGNYQYSYGGQEPNRSSEDKNVVVTRENLHQVMRETQEVFGGRP